MFVLFLKDSDQDSAAIPRMEPAAGGRLAKRFVSVSEMLPGILPRPGQKETTDPAKGQHSGR